MPRVLSDPIAWLLGYRAVPFSSRGIFRHELQHVLLWAVVWGSLNAPFCGYIALRSLHASDVLVSVITAAMAFANLFAVAWAGLLQRVSKRRLMITLLAATAVVLLSFALTPLCGTVGAGRIPAWLARLTSQQAPLGAVLFTLQVVLAWTALQGTNTVRTTIWRINYPAPSRGRVLARFAVWQMLIGALWVAVVGAYFDGGLNLPAPGGGRWTLDLGGLPRAGDPDAYGLFLPIAGLAGLISILFYRRVPLRGATRVAPEVEDAAIEPSFYFPGWLGSPLRMMRTGLADARRLLQRDAKFRDYMMWVFLSGSAVLMIQVPFLLILNSTFEITYATAALLLTFLPQVTVVVVTPLWGRLFDRWPLYYFRAVQISLWAVNRIVLAVAVWQASMPGVVLAVVLSGVALGGGRFAWQLGHMGFSNRGNDSLYLGVHQTLTGVRGLTMPLLGVVLYRYVLGWHIIWLSAVLLAVASAGYYRMHRREG